MQEIIDSLTVVGYEGDCLQEPGIEDILENGLNSKSFCSLISWLTGEIGTLLNLDEQIHPDSDASEFVLELSSLLKELSCPYQALVSGPTKQRFQNKDDRLLLLNYLITELMAVKMSHKLNPEKRMIIDIIESPAAVALKSITQNLKLGKPPQDITQAAYFNKLLSRFTEVFKKNENLWGKAVFIPSKSLTFEEWEKIEKLQSELDAEYDLRREMLITRLDVTIQSFQWSDTAKSKTDTIVDRYTNKRNELDRLLYQNKATDIVELLAARDDILKVEKTSSSNVRKKTHSDLEKHIIGMVPDRGGRSLENQRPPPEMPAWQKNRNQGGGNHGNRGGRGNHNYHQNQNPQQQRNYQPNYQNQGNNYSQNKTRRGGRVQGGWSGAGNNQIQTGDNYGDYSGRYQRDQDYNNRGGQDYNNRGGDRGGYHRGQSNYNRGGRR